MVVFSDLDSVEIDITPYLTEKGEEIKVTVDLEGDCPECLERGTVDSQLTCTFVPSEARIMFKCSECDYEYQTMVSTEIKSYLKIEPIENKLH